MAMASCHHRGRHYLIPHSSSGAPLLLCSSSPENLPKVASFEKPLEQSAGLARRLPDLPPQDRSKVSGSHEAQQSFTPTAAPATLAKAKTGGFWQSARSALWTTVAAGVVGHSAQRFCELLAFNTDSILVSDAVLLGAAWRTCPFENVRNVGEHKKAALLALVAAVAAGAASAAQRRRRRQRLEKQAVRLPGDKPIWRNALCPNGELTSIAIPQVTTLYEQFFTHAALKFADEPCLGRRTKEGFTWITYREAASQASQFGSGLRAIGLEPTDKFGIFSINKVEWFVAERACYTQNLIVVALYATLGDDAVAYVVSHSEMKAVLCSSEALPSILQALPQTPALTTIIHIDTDGGQPPTKEQEDKAEASGVRLLSFSAVLKLGAATPVPHTPPVASDLATIMYTSGTTGDPKGVLIAHSNIISVSVTGKVVLNDQGHKISVGDRYLSYLPLAHILERAAVGTSFENGAAVGVYGGRVEKLIEDIQALQPSQLAGVPRVFNRVHDRVRAALDSGGKVKQLLFKAAVAESSRALRAGCTPGSVPLWDALVFKKIRARLGGECRIILSGGAPLSASTQEFLTVAFGCSAIQGYGLTETCAAGTLGWPDDCSSGHVGPVVPCLELSLEDVPEMGYTTADEPLPRGEICFRGPAVMQGYYKEDQMTAEMIDKDGWLHTGDIGQVNANGTVTIIDRKKNIFKLAQGEYVAAERLEIAYQSAKLLAQIFVYGDSLQSVLVAVVVPDFDAVRDWARTNASDLAEATEDELCSSKAVRAAVLSELREVAAEKRLKGFEAIKAVHLDSEAFSVENGLLTPTFKLKRPQLKKKYSETVTSLYSTLKT